MSLNVNIPRRGWNTPHNFEPRPPGGSLRHVSVHVLDSPGCKQLQGPSERTNYADVGLATCRGNRWYKIIEKSTDVRQHDRIDECGIS